VTLLLPLLADALPERLVALAAGAGGRPALWRGALHLIADYGLSGGGLHSFAALYSQYVLVIPYYFVGHAHNLLLNVTLEQGVLGGAALYGLLLHAGWLLWRADGLRNTDNALRLLSWATLASLGILLLHSIVDDPLYGEPGTPLLLMAAGGCALLARLAFAARAARPVRAAPAAAMAGLLLGVGLLLAWWPLPAQVTALRGALTMNRVDLAGWPPGEWDTGANAAALAPAAELLAAAADADAGNVTAQYRLGLVALEARMFETAVFHLEQAHAAAPTHRGVTKTLGYSYVWLGELDQARQTLAGVAETADEMAVYAWWWEQQGRPDLAAQAAAMRP
ncbi:MAG: O-antigen ligase family protein, partial [Anaerolineales bacterium]|nr:O-antigen ligase family protein [Anaerolineales bacterium]